MKQLQSNNLPDLFNNLKSKPAVVFFHATWWGPCKQFEQVLDEVSEEYSLAIDFYQCNIEKASKVASLYSVKSIPQLTIIRKDGKAENLIGGKTREQLKYYFDGVLNA